MQKINRQELSLEAENINISDNKANMTATASINFSRNKCRTIISMGLLFTAVCISICRYIMIGTPVAERIDEPDTRNDNIVSNEASKNEDTDIDIATEDDWEDYEDFAEDTAVSTSSNNIIIFGKGDTLGKVLERFGINKTDIHNVSLAISKVFPIRKIKTGQKIVVKSDEINKTSLNSLEFKPDKRFRIIVEKSGKQFIAKKVSIPLTRMVKSISGSISPQTPSFSLQKCGLKKSMANDVLRALGQVTNITSAKSHVNFDLVYEQYCTENNEVLDSNLLAVVATVNGKLKKVYKFSVDGAMQYIDENGTVLSHKKCNAMFIRPIAYKKITSHFGYRIHPISGRKKMHTGVDLAASIGTPVRASASGRVSMASNNKRGYGKYIKIQHSGNYSTAYAHLSRIVVTTGQIVSQGQVIGYCGNSGYTTGSHLHYEKQLNGKFVNPLMFVKEPSQKLSKRQLMQFNEFKRNIHLKTVKV